MLTMFYNKIISASCLTRSSQQARSHSTKWTSSIFNLTLYNDQQMPHTYQMELGEAEITDPNPTSPSILAVHSSASSYNQWSGLAAHIEPRSCSGLFGLNMFGYGLSEKWNIDQRKQRITDHVMMVSSAAAAAKPDSSWHLVGHSMGGGSVLATAATKSEISERLASVAVFDPNLYCLLLVGNKEEQENISEGDNFCEQMLAATAAKDWEMYGNVFHQFWFDGGWDALDEGTKKAILHISVPHTVYECQSLLWAREQGPALARSMMDTLANLRCKKKMIIAAAPGNGSKRPLIALSKLLKREAGFEIIHAPVGGHMGPITHGKNILPLFLP